MSTFKRLLPTILMLLFEAVIGVMLLINGEKFTEVIFIIFGVVLLICGLVTLIRALLAGRNGGTIPTFQLIGAVVLLAIGGFFAAAAGNVLPVVSAFTLIFGIILAFSGMLKLIEFFSIRQSGGVAWFAAIGAIVTIIIGIVIAFNPFASTEVMWIIMGILLLVSVVFDIISLIIFGIALKKGDVKVTVIEAQAKDID